MTEHTGKDLEVIERSMDRDNFLDPVAAKEFGLIDEVVTHRELDPDDEAGKNGKDSPNDSGGTSSGDDKS